MRRSRARLPLQGREDVRSLDELRSGWPDAALQLSVIDELDRVRACLAELPPVQSRVLTLRSSGYDYHDISSAVAVSDEHPRKLVQLARAAYTNRGCQ